MCLTGCLLELLCGAAEGVKEIEQVVNVTEELKQSPKLSEMLKESATDLTKTQNSTGTGANDVDALNSVTERFA